MDYKYLYDLNDHASSWRDPFTEKREDGSDKYTVARIIEPEGPRFLYWVLDDYSNAGPKDTDCSVAQFPHWHVAGYETFFVDSGSLWLYINGQKAFAQKGDIIQIQPGQNHGMAWLEDTKWRGTYSDMLVEPEGKQIANVIAHMPELSNDPDVQALKAKGLDHIDCEPFLCKEVPTEQCLAIKNPDRPWASYEFDKLTVKIVVERWENGGRRELPCFSMKPGFTAQWEKLPRYRDLLYVRKGKVKFTVMNEEFIAYDECVVDIPRFAPHSIEALEESDVYDLAGLPRWSMFLQNYASIKYYDPARLEKPETLAALKEQFNIPILSINS